MFDAVRHLADRLRPPAAGSDAELLGRFTANSDEAAFAELVRRHGPMVFGVCRRLTRSHHDAEDAFQAAFLVLAARPERVRPAGRVGAFLHGVAVNAARKAAARKRTLPLTDVPAPHVPDPDLAEHLDTALSALPTRYRLPLVLCHLEGRTRKEAADALGWPEGTVSGRLARGLALLRQRLGRQGLAVPAAGLAVLVPGRLLADTPRLAVLIAAGVAPPTHLLPLTARGLPMTPLRTAAVLLVGLSAGAAGLAALPAADPPPSPAPQPAARPAPQWVGVAKLTRPAAVKLLAFGPKSLVVYDNDGGKSSWHQESRQEEEITVSGGDGQRKGVRLGFSADGKWLYGITEGGRLLWRSPSDKLNECGGLGGPTPTFHDFSPDGQTWLCWYDYAPKGIHLRPNGWDPTPPERRELVGVEFDHDVKRAVMSADNKWLAVALANNTVQMVEREELKKGTILSVTGGPAVDLQFSPDSGRLAIIEPGDRVTVFAHSTGVKLATLAGHDGGTSAVAFHSDGNLLATAGADKTVRLWDAATGKAGQVLRGHTEAVGAVALSPDGKRLASGSADKTARVWEFRR